VLLGREFEQCSLLRRASFFIDEFDDISSKQMFRVVAGVTPKFCACSCWEIQRDGKLIACLVLDDVSSVPVCREGVA
jgi:molybdenum cofactor biosynthesis enzyme MoaA